MNVRLLPLIAPMLALVASTPFASAQDSEIEELKAMMRDMQKTINAQNTRIATLENQKTGQVEKSAPQKSTTAITGKSPEESKSMSGAAASDIDLSLVTPASAAFTPKTSVVPDADLLGDLQKAAPRVNNAMLDPDLKGYMTIPGTETIFKLGGSARIDAVLDFGNNGNPNQFTPSSIPVRGEPGWDGGERTSLQAKATRLNFEIRRPVPYDSNLRLYYENDFYNDSSTNSMNYRLRHFYGQAWNFLIGQTYSAFQDIDVFPDVVDYQGPNGIVNRRQPQIRYTYPVYDHGDSNFQLFASVEQPDGKIDLENDSSSVDPVSVNHTPDGVAGFRLEGKPGHLKGAALFRNLSYESDSGANDETFGWGLTLAGALNLLEKDKLSAQVTYGQGVSRYINDLSGENLDAAYVDGRLEAIPVAAAMAGYSHQWSDQWRSTVAGGYVHADVPSSLGPFSVQDTVYGSVNLMWHPTSSFRMGLEYLYGFKETLDGSDANANRLNFVVRYDLVR